MSGIPIHLHGNVVRDPELRVTTRGDHVANLTVACNPTHYDKASGRWVDDPPSFFQVSCWHALADNVRESVAKGDPVFVSGQLKQRKHVREDGTSVTYTDVEARVIGHDLSRGVSRFERRRRDAAPESATAQRPQTTQLDSSVTCF